MEGPVGITIDRECFNDDEYASFAARLRGGLRALRELLQRPGFGLGAPTVGAELEVCLVDADGRPVMLNQRVLADAKDPRVSLELDRFNLEFNSTPVAFAGRPFTALETELIAGLDLLARAAARRGARVLAIGILPSLTLLDLQRSAMTDLPRYRALSAGLRRVRSGPFRVQIRGDEDLDAECDDVTLEGAATSLQLHLRVAPDEFAAMYNAAQIATAPVLAVSGNSPFLLGRRLWRETRIALFKQAVDARRVPSIGGWPPARVSFGHGWVRDGAYELFAEAVAHHAPLVPVITHEDPIARVHAGELPELAELRLHNGTVWRWNRAVYDHSAGGHVRIELRALPAGPTPIDMMANAAFLIGLTRGLARRMDELMISFPFSHAHRNFYRAAQHGLDFDLLWPCPDPPAARMVPARELLLELLPVAQAGLESGGVATSEALRMLGVIEARVRSGQTGSEWQRRRLELLRARCGPAEAFARLVGEYQAHSAANLPVHSWPVVDG